MATPATRMTSFTAVGRGQRPRVVAIVAVLALELDEATDRQPVQRVEGLALGPEDLRPRREPDPELEDADAGQPGGDEVTELVDEHQRPRG